MANYSNQDDERSVSSEVASDLAKQGGGAAKGAAKAASRKLTKQAGKVGLKMAKAGVAKLGGAIAALSSKLLLIVGTVAFAVLLIYLAWYILFEIRGSSGEYSGNFENKNEFALNDEAKDKRYQKATGLKGENDAIYRFYQAIAYNSYYAIDLEEDEDSDKRLVPAVEARQKDYYEQEDTYSINANFVYALDTYAHQGKFIYPEQFIKPVPYDDKTFKEVPLTNEFGLLTIESRKYDKKKEEYDEKKKVISVDDYGFASVFKYKEDELTQFVEGKYYLRDEYDSGCECAVQVPMSEPYKNILPGYPKKIDLADEGYTFAQNVKFAYKERTDELSGLSDGESSDPASTMNKIYSGSVDVYKDVDGEDDEDGNPTTVSVFSHTVKLYKYRDGAVMETKPVPDAEKIEEVKHKRNYVQDYFNYYEAWIPKDAMDGFNFEERVAGMSFGVNMELGSSVDSAKYQTAFQYFPIAKLYGDMYGVDPHLIIAVMTQESGGKNINADGPMQIVGASRTIKAENVQTGKKETFTITHGEKGDFDKSIHFSTMFLANLIAEQGGNTLKGLQAYNFNLGGFLKTNYPEAWADETNNSWLEYREEARQHYAAKEGYAGNKSASNHCMPDKIAPSNGAPLYGDTCYIENVLQYYAGDMLTSFIGKDKDKDKVEGEGEGEKEGEKVEGEEEGEKVEPVQPPTIAGGLLNVIKKAAKRAKGDGDDDADEEPIVREQYTNKFQDSEVERMLTYAQSFEQYLPMSMVNNADEALFWSGGFDAANEAEGLGGDGVDGVDGADGPVEFGNGLATIDGMVKPIQGVPFTIGSGWGPRKGGYHPATDASVARGTPLHAVYGGVVTGTFSGCPQNGWNRFIGQKPNCDNGAWTLSGNHVRIQLDNGDNVVYSHLSKVNVRKNQRVEINQIIGLSGNSGSSTGPHLHFEYRKGSYPGKDINPIKFFR